MLEFLRRIIVDQEVLMINMCSNFPRGSSFLSKICFDVRRRCHISSLTVKRATLSDRLGAFDSKYKVAVSLAACIYFLNEKTKSFDRAFVIGVGVLATGLICGSIFVPMIPTVVIHPTWTLELLTSLVAYVFLFLVCTFLK